jgi:hypothetical protein
MLLPWKKFIYCLFQGLTRRSETCIQIFASAVLSDPFLCIKQKKYFSNFSIHSPNTQIPLRNDSCTFMTENSIQFIIKILSFYKPLSQKEGRETKKNHGNLENRDFTANLMHNFLYSTIVSYHAPLHVSSVTALILRRTMYICSIWFSHALYAAIRGTD